MTSLWLSGDGQTNSLPTTWLLSDMAPLSVSTTCIPFTSWAVAQEFKTSIHSGLHGKSVNWGKGQKKDITIICMCLWRLILACHSNSCFVYKWYSWKKLKGSYLFNSSFCRGQAVLWSVPSTRSIRCRSDVIIGLTSLVMGPNYSHGPWYPLE